MEDFRPVVSRRRLLQAAGFLALCGAAGCGGSASPPPQPAATDPDGALLAHVRAEEDSLIAAYDATIARYPRLRPTLSRLRAEHSAHLAAAVGRPAATPGAPTALRPAQVAGSAAGAVQALAVAERAAALARAGDCRTASPSLAGLLASIGASEAAHAAVLPALTRRPAVLR